jgi:S-adenosylmethionine hydrolase
LKKAKNASSETFPTLNLFANAACQLANGVPLEGLGRKRPNYRQMLMHAPPIGSDHLRASIIYIDSYGNLITNVKRTLFDEVGKGLQVEIVLRNNKHSIKRIHTNYNEVGENDLVALFNSAGYLEIALNRGAANKLLGLKVNDSLRIEFHV